jgi:hypothetical protein
MSGLLGGVSAKARLEDALQSSPVKHMEDGAMGSIRLVQSEPRSLGMVLVEAQWVTPTESWQAGLSVETITEICLSRFLESRLLSAGAGSDAVGLLGQTGEVLELNIDILHSYRLPGGPSTRATSKNSTRHRLRHPPKHHFAVLLRPHSVSCSFPRRGRGRARDFCVCLEFCRERAMFARN